jgi:hypothetical protein
LFAYVLDPAEEGILTHLKQEGVKFRAFPKVGTIRDGGTNSQRASCCEAKVSGSGSFCESELE